MNIIVVMADGIERKIAVSSWEISPSGNLVLRFNGLPDEVIDPSDWRTITE